MYSAPSSFTEKGTLRDADYHPSPPKQGVSTALGGVLKKVASILLCSPDSLQFISEMISKVEAIGDKLSSYGAPLWNAHLKGTLCSANGSRHEGFVRLSCIALMYTAEEDGQWSCGKCTLMNDDAFTSCSLCSAPRPESEKWSLTGPGKRQRRVCLSPPLLPYLCYTRSKERNLIVSDPLTHEKLASRQQRQP